MAHPRRALKAATAGAVVAGLAVTGMVGMVAVGSGWRVGRPSALLDTGFLPAVSRRPSTEVEVAQARVAQDLAALRASAGRGTTTPSTQQLGNFGAFARFGPKTEPAQYDYDFTPQERGMPLARPKHAAKQVLSQNGEPSFNYGPNVRYCPGGNCERLDAAMGTFAAERWPMDVYRALPWMAFDPDASPARNRAINEREGEFADEGHPQAYHPPVQWGTGQLKGEGTMASADRGVDKLGEAGVDHDKLPWDLYRSLPWPGFDRTQYDRDAHADRYPHMDPLDAAQEAADSKKALSSAGIIVDRLPTDTKSSSYIGVDGLSDQLVPVEHAPKWRKGGIASQEEPSSFLLTEHPDLSAPQPTQDSELGYEIPATKASADQQAYWGFWDSLGFSKNA